METIPEDSTNQTNQTQAEPQRIEISPLQLLVNAVFLGYQRGVYTMKEAGIISQAIDFFTIETKQAIVPVTQGQGQGQVQVQKTEQDESSSVKSEKVIMQSQ
jgi:hypothetical protein